MAGPSAGAGPAPLRLLSVRTGTARRTWQEEKKNVWVCQALRRWFWLGEERAWTEGLGVSAAACGASPAQARQSSGAPLATAGVTAKH